MEVHSNFFKTELFFLRRLKGDYILRSSHFITEIIIKYQLITVKINFH